MRIALLLLLTLPLAACGGCGGNPYAVPVDTAPAARPGNMDDPNIGRARAASVVTDETGMPTPGQILSWVEDFTEFGHRRSGTEALRRAEEYILQHFETIGLEDVRFEESTTWQWEAEAWGLQVAGEDIDSFPVHHCFITPGEATEFSTGPSGLTAELVDIGNGSGITPDLVEGKIAVFDLDFIVPSVGLLLTADFWWDPAKSALREPRALLQSNPYITSLPKVAGELMDAGAVGFVGVLADYFDSNQYYNEYYRRQEFTIPAVWVTRTEGANIRRLARGGADATLTMEGFRREVPARTVIGMLPGRSNETIQVQSHHDSTWDGAVQDGSGAAALLALAHYYAAQPAESREKSMMFTTFSSHWTGYQAHQDFVERYVTNNESPYAIVANVTVEHIAKHGTIHPRTRELVVAEEAPEPRGILHTVSYELAEGIANAVKEHDMRRTAVMRPHIIGMPTDASFMYTAGVPVVSLISGPLYLYDAADTLDKVPVGELYRVPRTMAAIIDLLDATPAEAIGDDGIIAGMKHGEFDRAMGGWVGGIFRWLPFLRRYIPSETPDTEGW